MPGADAQSVQTLRQIKQNAEAALATGRAVSSQSAPSSAAAAVRTVTILGQVKKSGSIPLPADRSVDLVDVILLADGFNEMAKTNAVKLIRILPDGTQQNWDNLDIGGMLSGRVDRKTAPAILPNDIVNVPMRMF